MANKIRELYESELLLLDEGTAPKYFLGTLKFSFAKADTRNKNGRIYPASLLQRECRRMIKKINKSPIAGMLEHDPAGLIRLDRISHIITGLEWDNQSKTTWAEAKILKTQKGQDLLVLLNCVRLGASMVGHGEVFDGIVQDSYEMKSIDLVSDPSFGKDAEVSSSNLIESGNGILTRELDKNDDLDVRYFILIAEAKHIGHPDPVAYAKNILKEKK